VPKKSAFSPALVVDERHKFAVKIIRARDEEYQSVALKEYYLLKQLGHTGVIKMVDAFVNNSSHSIYLVMELVQGLPLK
jgi:serine/threonine protein kinase